jgi:hypothetical protein
LNEESSIFGVSLRGILALITVSSGLLFLYLAAFLLVETGSEGMLLIFTAVIGFINLALGFYLGQKVNNGSN